MMKESKTIRVKTRKKWRPSLALVIFAVLITVMAMPFMSLIMFRFYENQLIQQTESELIGQASVLSSMLSYDWENSNIEDLPLGEPRSEQFKLNPDAPLIAIQPTLDLAKQQVLDVRPSSQETDQQLNPVYNELQPRLIKIIQETQRLTLAGFRVISPNGIVIAGDKEVGQSLAHLEEVQAALLGEYKAVMRKRNVSRIPPAFYSLSRGTSLRVYVAMPFFVKDRVAGIIYMVRTPNNILKHMVGVGNKISILIATILLGTLIIGFVFWRAITGPLHALSERTTKISRGDRMSIKALDKHGTKEVAHLSQSFLDMAQSLFERADYISTFTAHVSHELKSPLTSIQGAAELLKHSYEKMSQEERKKFLDNIMNDTSRLKNLVNRLRELAYADNPDIGGSTDFSPVIEDLRVAYPDIKIKVFGNIDTEIAMSHENASIIFGHLVDNATRHGATEIKLKIDDEVKPMTFKVMDNGNGISDQNKEKIFDSFFTTRRESGGTGMGLGIVQSMLVSHGGEINLCNVNKGACFKIQIPEA